VARLELSVRVTPRAGADKAGPYLAGILHVRVTRPAAHGEANHAVARVVARAIGVPRSAVTPVAGSRSRIKRLAIEGLTAEELSARLRGLGD
jgi:uncharacterized protein